MARERSTPYPALAGSVLLHLDLVLIGLFVLPWLTRPIQIGQVVPVTLISSKDSGALKAAEEAPVPAPAATPEPAPTAPPQPPAPQPAPQPTPAPAPPKPAPPKPTPTPAKPTPAKPEKSLDLDALAASLSRQAARSASARQSSAAKGPARPNTAVKAQATSGATDVAASGALASMAAELQRIWNPNCDVSGGADANIRLSFRLASNGRLIGQPESSAETASDPVVKAASDRAKSAVNQAAPYENLPPALYGPKIVVNFNARQACAQR